jgi:hypothetical protein
VQTKEQQARAKKMKERGELEELMQLELEHKEKELQASLQREKIARELKKVSLTRPVCVCPRHSRRPRVLSAVP